MNKGEIITVLSELNKITGLRISLHGQDYKEIAAYPESSLPFCAAVHKSADEHRLCAECDKIACDKALSSRGTYIYKCRYGLTEAVSPLYNFGTLTGFLMMGQCAQSAESAELACERLSKRLLENAPGTDVIPIVGTDMLTSYARIMTICAQYLTLSNAMPSERPGAAELAKRYIYENLSEKFTISDICKSLGCSKSTLLSSFRKKYGTTVNAYVTEARLELSKKLLREGKTVGEAACESGFGDQSYFSKVFSARYGTPPSSYKTELKNERQQQ